MIRNSVLNFTKEVGINDKLPFLDVLINSADKDKYATEVYIKPTKGQDCLNYECEAPERYKTGVLKTLLSRAWRICSDRASFNNESNRIKKLLVNNNYPNKLCDKITTEFLKKKERLSNDQNGNPQEDSIGNLEERQSAEDGAGVNSVEPKVAKIFYKNQFHKNYRQDETALRQILKRHVFEVETKIDFIVYYHSSKTSDMLIRNNPTCLNKPDYLKSHLVYKFTCALGECRSLSNKNTYIGMTTMTLKDRLGAHRFQGSIFAHIRLTHGVRVDLDTLIKSTEIIYKENDPIQLHIFEALHIRKLQPSLNENKRDFTCLKLNIFN